MNEIENKSQIKSMKQNIRFLKSSKINKSLAKLIKKKERERNCQYQKGMGDTISDTKGCFKKIL